VFPRLGSGLHAQEETRRVLIVCISIINNQELYLSNQQARLSIYPVPPLSCLPLAQFAPGRASYYLFCCRLYTGIWSLHTCPAYHHTLFSGSRHAKSDDEQLWSVRGRTIYYRHVWQCGLLPSSNAAAHSTRVHGEWLVVCLCETVPSASICSLPVNTTTELLTSLLMEFDILVTSNGDWERRWWCKEMCMPFLLYRLQLTAL